MSWILLLAIVDGGQGMVMAQSAGAHKDLRAGIHACIFQRYKDPGF